MATWEKTGTAWFGDTFNRDMTLCSTEIAYDAALDSNCTSVKAINWNGSDSATVTCNTAAIDRDVLDSICGYNNYATKDSLYELQVQINDLKKKIETKKECSELRSALKTLHYKREVE